MLRKFDKTNDSGCIWKNFSTELKTFIAKRVQNSHDVDDILQDVFIKIHTNIHKLKQSEKLVFWLYQITRNAIIDYYRSNKRRFEHLDDFAGSLVYNYPEQYESNINKELEGFIMIFINSLPLVYKDALMCTEIEGLTQKEFAEKAGLSISGAKSRVQRARTKLKENLLRCCDYMLDSYGNVLDYKIRSNHDSKG